ncbi:MAG: PD40 domain-containing protein [Bacteroidetes bacterium]|nr:PD40 domain-containing protein [Bacteroidota bacterium]
MLTRSLYILLLCFFALDSFSQAKGLPGTIDDADQHFDHKNFLMAMPIYKAELKRVPDNKELLYKLGLCYLNTKINREEAVKYLEQYTKDPKCKEEAWIDLGRAYHLVNKIDAALGAYAKYKSLKPKRESEIAHFVEQCNNAQKLMNNAVHVSFQNLGKEINSEDPDYYPFVNGDETFLTFTSRRKDNVGGKKIEIDGYHSSDIYYSKVENGKWAKVTNAGRNINGALDEQAVGLKADGLEMYVYLDHIDKFGDIYVSKRADLASEFPKPKICDPIINEKIETSGCLNEDGTIMFFARREKVEETSDLFVCRKLPNGKWALPQKLPPSINTIYNEDFPYLSSDGKTLYFSSEGHNSIGGYDLFKTTWDVEQNIFSKPENLGFPINSTDDDRNICVTPDNRVAYISAFRTGGFGDLDIYRIKFDDNEQISKIYTGKVFLGDTAAAVQPKSYVVSMNVTNTQSNIDYLFTPHSKTGKFVMSLPVGKYEVVISADGYQDYKEVLIISDIGRIDMEKNKNFVLKKK